MELEQARKLHDDLLAAKPEGARHDSDICQFCVEKASTGDTSSGNPPASGRSGEPANQPTRTTEGGTKTPMSDISQEAHEALLAKAVKDATSATDAALATKVTEIEALKAEIATLTADKSKADEDNKRLNTELDAAQVAKKTAEDKAAKLEQDIADKDAAAAKSEVASKRSEQVTNLKLFPAEYVQEKAALWAELSDADWAARLDEWAKLHPATDTEADDKTKDAASAMSGTSGDLTKTPSGDTTKTSSRRSVLGLA